MPKIINSSDTLSQLLNLQDVAYRDFHSRLVPQIDKESIIGVRTPLLKKLALQVSRSGCLFDFLSDLPHKYYEENNLHAFIISKINDFDTCIQAVNDFLPYIDNWATCDGLRPVCFSNNKEKLLPFVFKWIDDERTYVRRFGIEVLMNHYLGDEFDVYYHEVVSKIVTEEYYVRMMIAWYFATALAKQYEATISYIESARLDKWTHNKTIQKAIESYRIADETKMYLKTLKA